MVAATAVSKSKMAAATAQYLLVALAALSFPIPAAAADVIGDGLRIIEAPFDSVMDFDGQYQERQQGPTAWACADFAASTPWLGYSSLESYLSGGNDKSRNLLAKVILYPLQEIHSSDGSAPSTLCIFLEKQDHCYPPVPLQSTNTEIRKLFDPIKYYSVRYWGQSSTERTTYYQEQLKNSLTEANKPFKQDYYIVSYYPNHVREVRYDAAEATVLGEKTNCPSAYTKVEEIGCLRYGGEAVQSHEEESAECTRDGGHLFEPDEDTTLVAMYYWAAEHKPSTSFAVAVERKDGVFQWVSSGEPVTQGEWLMESFFGSSSPDSYDCAVLKPSHNHYMGYLTKVDCASENTPLCLHDFVH